MNFSDSKARSLFGLFFLCFSVLSFGQTDQFSRPYRFKSISVNDQLSHSDANAIVQDHDGYIWIGTNNGLNRFDGYQLSVFKYNLEDTSSIPGNRIKKMVVDLEGQIWLALETKGVFRFHPQEMIFREVPIPFPELRVLDLVMDKEGHIWINKTEFGLIKVSKHTPFEIMPFPVANFSLYGGSVQINSIQFTNDQIYALTNNYGIWVFNPNKENFQQAIKEKDLPLLKAEQLLSLAITDGLAHIGTDKGRLLSVPKSRNNVYDVANTTTFPLPQRGNVHSLLKDINGHFWLGTNAGLFQFLSVPGKSAKPPKIIRYQFNDLLNNNTNCLFLDHYGMLWTGTNSGGVNYTNLRGKAFKHVPIQTEEGKPSRSHAITSIYRDKERKIWIGTRSGLYHYKPFSDSYLVDKVDIPSHNLGISFIYKDKEGEEWIGIRQQGLFRMKDPFGQLKLEGWDKLVGASAQPHFNTIRRISEDQQNRFWISTYHNGLFLLDKKKPDYLHFTYDALNTNSLSSDKLTDVYCDPKDGSIWVGTIDGGLNHITVAPGIDSFQIKHYRFDAKDPTSISTDHCWQIMRTKDGTLWVATLGGGINKGIEQENGDLKFERFTINDGLKDNDVESFLEDEKGNLWLAGVGLTKFNPKERTFRHFNYHDGLQSNSFKVGTEYKDHLGTLYFGGINGINYFNPGELELDSIPPNVLLTKLSINNEQVEVGQNIDGRTILESSLTKTSSISLNANENNFSIHFVGLQLTTPEKNQYLYQLEGLDQNWIPTQYPNLSAQYNNIPPGRYTFKVKAANGDGIWSPEMATLSIVIARPWYATNLALAFYAICIGLALFLFRQNTIRRSNLKNDLILAEKDRQLNRAKLTFFTHISHELRSPLTLIKGPLEDLLLQPKLKNNIREKLFIIQNSSNRLLRLVNQLLDFRKMETGNMSLQAASGNFVKFAKEILLIFSQSASDKEIAFIFESPKDQIHLYFDRDKMEIVLMNLLHNAYKNTPDGGKITLRLRIKGDELKESKFLNEQVVENFLLVEVEDTGIGLDTSEMEKIFAPYYQVSNMVSKNLAGTGIGLALTKGIVNLHHGSINVISELGQGALFNFQIPFGKAHLKPENINQEFKNSEYIGHYLIQDQKNLQDSLALSSNYFEKIENRSKKFKVLVVEDNFELRSYIKSGLEEEFWIEEASNGQEAYEMILDEAPDLIVSDVMMPIMDGIQLCEQIKSNELVAHVPIILLTARTANVYKTEGLETGAEDYITKPFSIQYLRSKINAILQNRRYLQEFYHRQLFFKPITKNNLNPSEELVHKAICIVEEHLEDSQFSVEQMAKFLGQSKSNVYRKIKLVTGKSLVEFIRDVRLRKAAQLLQEDKWRIAEVAYKVGFSDVKYFSKCFKKLYKVNPSEYSIQKHQKNNEISFFPKEEGLG